MDAAALSSTDAVQITYRQYLDENGARSRFHTIHQPPSYERAVRLPSTADYRRPFPITHQTFR